MMRSLWTGCTGMIAQQTNLDVIANNLANVNTTGFKKNQTSFEDLMYQMIRQPGATSGADNNQLPTGLQIGHGTRPVANAKLYLQGDYQSTGNPFDICIEGDGFFQILMPDGTTAYTRDGSFKVDGEGRIVTSEGYVLQPELVVPNNATNFTVAQDGIVTVTIPGTTTPQDIGQIQLARFINPAGLQNVGHNLALETAASGVPTVNNPGEDGTGITINQYIEMSNVKVVEEMVNLIVAQRAYEVNSKVITTSDEMLSQASGLKR